VIKTMYITGSSAFSTVHMKFFIQSTPLKTQRLNIRINFDRKTIIFIAMYTLNKCVKICRITKLCAYWSLPRKVVYTQSLEEDQDGVSTCTCTMAKTYCPICLLQKMMEKLVIKNIKVEILGYVPYVYNNLPTNKGSPQKPQCTMWLHI